jgi:cobyrinic acid a,c-diamide synthase
MSRILISAAHKSSGKTTLSIGLCAALSHQGYQVQPFKKGPDYIDPMWLNQACGRACYNLDFNTQSTEEIKQTFFRQNPDADLHFIEGNKGLYDGVDPVGSDCNAALASLLDTPVVLIIDAQGITRGVAPLVIGYQQFDPNICIVGVILNKVAGDRHERKLREALKRYTSIPVLGAVRKSNDLFIDERHLGLVPSNEHQYSNSKIAVMRQHVEEQVDLDQLIGMLDLKKTSNVRFQDQPDNSGRDLRIGIVQDSAFGFYYQDDLQAFHNHGARLIPVDLIKDEKLPELDGLFIGGGFPETHMKELSHNKAMRQSVDDAVQSGLPVYAECGGLMYLCRDINWHGETLPMAGALPASVVMHERPQGRGYVKLRETGCHPWIAGTGRIIPAHEFHHSSLQNIGDEVQFAYDVVRGQGIQDGKDGIVYKNTLAGYAHLRDTERKHWVSEFLSFVRKKH